MKTQQDINILSFSDHRAYLQAILSPKMGKSPQFGLRSFSKKAGFTSASTLSMVMNGKRKLSLPVAEKIAKGLALKGRSKRYLFALAKLDTAKTNEDQALARELILRIKSVAEESQVELKQYRFLSIWYYPAIYVLAGAPNFKENSIQIANRLGRGITESLVKSALNDMVQLGLLQEKSGTYSQTLGPISTANEIKNSAVYQYHRQMISLGLQALELPLQEREMNGLTVAASEQQLAIVKEKIRKFRKDLNEYLSQGEQTGEVYQLNIQFFPLTQSSKQKEVR